MQIKDWLNAPPSPEEIREKDGGKYIPYHIIVEKLNQLCPDGWSTSNFQFHTCYLPDRSVMVSGSLDVSLKYKENSEGEVIKRTLSGAATFVISSTSNPHPAATVKSLALMNAVKPLGRQFGWGLNAFDQDTDCIPSETTIQVAAPPEEKENFAETLIGQINSCTDVKGLESFRFLVKNSPELFKRYLERMKELTSETPSKQTV